MTAHLLDRDGTPQARIDPATLEGRLHAGEFFWLDLQDPGPDDYALLRDVFGFHPLPLEDSEHFGQRPKLEDYGEFAFLVLYGAAPPPDEDRLVEVHAFYSERHLVTVRRDEAPAFEQVRERYARRPGRSPRPVELLYQLLDALVDSFFPALGDLGDRIDVLQDEMLAGPSEEQLQEIFALRRRLVEVRRTVASQRDLVGRFVAGDGLPGLDEDARRYFRDVHDHLIRLGDQVDVYREILTGSMDLYLTTVSNRLNTVMKRLTVIATIALPLVVITGFFGQNFAVLVDHIGSTAAFVGYGVVLPVAAIAVLAFALRRRGLF
ncbi:MAG TPA: magnesium transporter CorA family protein [Gaiellaceae bacterium]|nr:magnesium transporter CorA family protein [Gaiellaceae bacterium]